MITELLPADIQRNIGLFLCASDVLSYLTTSRVLHENLDGSQGFWKALLDRDGVEQEYSDNETVATLKRAFFTNSHASRLESVRWCATDQEVPRRPSARRGHNMCVLGPPNNRMVVVLRGDSNDERIHVLRLNGQEQEQHFQPLTPHGQQPPRFHGESFTPLNERQAVRFGGFGVVSGLATNDVDLLTLKIADDGTLTPSWERITTHGTPPPGVMYHSATLIHNRYLLIIGRKPAILDTVTWTWFDIEVTASYETTCKPSPRYGHSVVLDCERNRLVLFGGTSSVSITMPDGTNVDFAIDSADVWELRFGQTWDSDFENSFPWNWSRIHNGRAQDDEEDNNDDETAGARENNQQQLSPVDRMCLGRGHVCAKISRDNVLFLFGDSLAGNGVLGYDLSCNSFKRPNIQGPVPLGRWEAAATLIDSNGWLLVHGGDTQEGVIGNVDILDLAPALERAFPSFATVSEAEAVSHPQIRDEDVRVEMPVLLNQIMSAPNTERRQEVARQLLEEFQGRVRQGVANLMSSIASGQATLQEREG